MKQTNRKGFTLAELLIVVAIIAVLVAIAIPVFTKQLHNARAATDLANVRSYYAEIQADYMSTGEYNNKVPDLNLSVGGYDYKTITLLNGEKIKILAGNCAVIFEEGKGYSMSYNCDSYHPEHELLLSN